MMKKGSDTLHFAYDVSGNITKLQCPVAPLAGKLAPQVPEGFVLPMLPKSSVLRRFLHALSA